VTLCDRQSGIVCSASMDLRSTGRDDDGLSLVSPGRTACRSVHWRTTSKDLRSDLGAFVAVLRSLLYGCYMVGVRPVLTISL
jgi:hypothetical protein